MSTSDPTLNPDAETEVQPGAETPYPPAGTQSDDDDEEGPGPYDEITGE